MRRLRPAALLAVLLLYPLPASAVGWLSGYTYRAPVTVTNSTGATLSGYQVTASFNSQSLVSSGKMRSDCGDLRVTDSDGSTQLGYWIESGCNANPTVIWIKVPSLTAGSYTLYLYYGNTTATYNNTTGGTNTFTFFDDFSNGLTQWTLGSSQGTGGIVSGALDLSVSGANAYRAESYNSVASITTPYILDVRENFISFPCSSGVFASGLFFPAASGYTYIYYYGVGCNSFYNNSTGYGYIVLTGWHDNEVVVGPTSKPVFDFLFDGSSVIASNAGGGSGLSGKIGFEAQAYKAGDTAHLQFDDVRVRQYASPEPTTSVGSEVNNIPSFTSVSDAPDPLKAGATSTITTVASDAAPGDALTLYVCKAADGTAAGCGAGGTWCTATPAVTNPTCSFPVPATTGSYNYYAYIFDSVGAAAPNNPLQGTFYADVDPPTVSAIAVSPNPNSSGAQTLSWTDSDVGTGLASVQIQLSVNGGAFGTITSMSGATTTWTQFPPVGAGQYVYRVIVSDVAGNATTVTSPAVIVDTTAPTAGQVRDGLGADLAFQASTSTLSANWSGFADPETGIAGYAWAIGTTQGGTDVMAFTSVGSATNATQSGLALAQGTTYYASVRATNGAGLSTLASSNGVQILGGACASASGCASGFCVDGVCCDTACGGGDPTDCQACGVAAGAAANGTCGAVSAGRICRPAAGSCDVAESCDGTSLACPADAFLSSTTVCRASAGPCDVAESCTGTSASCPADAFQPSTTVCRPSTGACDAAETCTGSSASCPADALDPAGTVCRPAAGPCDVAETCDGASAACPADALDPAGTVCRPAAGPCDVAESCDGVGAACPSDAFLSSTAVCRPAAGPCDLAETCTGTGASCPADAFQPSSTVCRPSAGPCDLPEWCTGSSVSCPPDSFIPAGFVVCRPASGPCDLAETCAGNSPNCPADGSASDGTACAGGTCSAGVCTATVPDAGVPDAGMPAVDAGAPDAGVPDAGMPAADAGAPDAGIPDAGMPAADAGAPDAGGTDAGPCKIQIAHDAVLTAAIGVPYRYNATGQVTVDQPTGAVHFSSCAPATGPTAGFQVDQSTGLIYWTPTFAGLTSLCVKAEDTCSSDRYTFDVDVAAAAVSPPTARIDYSPMSVRVNQPVTFDGTHSGADPTTTLVSYDWAFGDGTTASGSSVTHAFAVAGGYVVRLTVTDGLGSTAHDVVAIPVGDSQCANPPTVQITGDQLTGADSLTVHFGCNCQSVVSEAWDFGDGTGSTDAAPTHTFAPGRYHVRLAGVDLSGCIGSDSTEVVVAKPPYFPPICQAAVAPSGGPVPLAVAFTAAYVDPNPGGTITEARWTFDDGTASDQANFGKTFTTPALVHASLKVVDNHDLACTDAVDVVVQSAAGETPLQIVTPPVTHATCRQPYHYSVATNDRALARGSHPVAWKLGKQVGGKTVGDPDGMNVDAQGTLSWIPASGPARTEHVTLVASNGVGSTAQEFDVQVACTAPPPAKKKAGCGCGDNDSSALFLFVVASLFAYRRKPRRA